MCGERTGLRASQSRLLPLQLGLTTGELSPGATQAVALAGALGSFAEAAEKILPKLRLHAASFTALMVRVVSGFSALKTSTRPMSLSSNTSGSTRQMCGSSERRR